MADVLAVLEEYFNSRSGIVTLIKIKEVVDQLEKAATATEPGANSTTNHTDLPEFFDLMQPVILPPK
jgi:hypothetical protein